MSDTQEPKTPSIAPFDQIYCLAEGQWYALVNGKEFGHWPDKGSATAGMATEQRRERDRRDREERE